jgi:Rrf2 family protein
LHITKRADYAVRIMMELAGADGRLPARDLGGLAEVSYPFARSIITDLATAGLVDARRGPGGGVALARPARAISLLDIVEAIEGPVCLNVCVEDGAYCSRSAGCRAHGVWAKAARQLSSYLASQDLESLACRPATPTPVR